ncbi:MAG: alpha-2-macroglobulin [Deltaproteobacteria bacterium]|nr:alpha-2-macroglobulin [Deltaproteobacteria bacterium]
MAFVDLVIFVLKSILAFFIGEFTWQPPGWLRWLLEGFAEIGRAIRRFFTTKPALAWGSIATVCLVAAGAYFAWDWYERQPKPAQVTIASEPPPKTPIAEDAKPYPLVLTFSLPTAPLDAMSKPVTEHLKITPPIDGTWTWTNDRTLQFQPKVDWAIGQEYIVDIQRGIVAKHVELETREVRFTTEAFSVAIASGEFYVDPIDPKQKKVVYRARFSHSVDPSSFEKRLRLVDPNKKEGGLFAKRKELKFNVTYDKLKSEAYIHSELLPIPEEDGAVELTIAKGTSAQKGGAGFDNELSRRVVVPGMLTYFVVEKTAPTFVRNQAYEPEQVLIVELSDFVTPEELRKHLKVMMLPVDRPKTTDRDEQKNYGWYDASEVGPEILKLSTIVKLTPIPTEHDAEKILSFRYDAPAGRHLNLVIEKGMLSTGGYRLARAHAQNLRVPNYEPELRIMYDGAVLSSSGEAKLSLLSRDLKGVKVTLDRVQPSELNHFVSQTSGAFKSPSFRGYGFDFENVSDRFEEIQALVSKGPGKTQYSAIDLTPHFNKSQGKHGLFFLRVQGYDPAQRRLLGLQDARLILVTDLGVLVKDSKDGTHDLFVQSLKDGTPVNGAKVEVLGKNGVPIAWGTTDNDGHVALPTLQDFRHEKTPVVYVVRDGEDLSFLPFDPRDRMLQYSRFDVGGEYAAMGPGNLSAYLYSDRGLYRPGDPVHIGMITRAGDWSQAVRGVPLEVAVSDPRGVEIVKRKLSVGENGFDELTFTTEDTSPTGTYSASLYLVRDSHRSSLIGSTTVRVEEFLPDRMKIATRFVPDRAQGWLAPADLKARVELKNLFGTPADGHRVSSELTVSPAQPYFRAFSQYTFRAQHKEPLNYTERYEDENTDDKGAIEVDVNLRPLEKALYRLTYTAEGFELEGGRSVTASASLLVSALPFLVGYKTDGDLSYMKKGAKRSVELVAIDPSLTKVEAKNVTARLIERRYVSVLVRQRDDTFKYESVLKEVPASQKKITVSKAGGAIELETQKAGDFLVIFENDAGDELNRFQYSVMGEANLARSLEKNAELEIALDKADVEPGDEIEVSVKAPYTGAGLITVERERVLAWRWFKTTTTSTVQTIKVPKDLEGNGYINVAFVRATDSPEIFMSPLSYGVAPFSVSRKKREVAIELTSPELVRPGTPLKMRIKTDRDARAIVWAVDEGILQVAGYKRPDPLAHFFKKRALEVRTMQLLDLILPEFKLLAERAASGGDDAMRAIGQNLNPFKRKRDKPAVYWSGIVNVDERGKEVSFDVPDGFNGNLQIFALAVGATSIGVAQRSTIARDAFVLSPNVPSFVAPGDKFSVSVSVANTLEGSGDKAVVQLGIEPGAQLTVTGATTRSVKVGEGHEAVETFELTAKDGLGSVPVTFLASLDKAKVKRTTELSLRPAMPYETLIQGGYVEDDEAKVQVKRKLFPELSKREAAVSPLPLALSAGLLTYLEAYPYGCTEQIVSQTFGRLVLKSEPAFGLAPSKVAEHIAHTLTVLRSRQTESGAFGMWAANSVQVPWQSVYAAHFLTELKDRHEPFDDGMLKATLPYLRELLRPLPSDAAQNRVAAYALYVLARNGVVEGAAANALKARIDNNAAWKKDAMALHLAATFMLYKQSDAAERALSGAAIGDEQKPDYASMYDGLVRDALLVDLVARHFPQRLEKLDAKQLVSLAKRVASGDYHSLSAAYILIALEAYTKAFAQKTGGTPFAFAVQELDIGNNAKALALPAKIFAKTAVSDKAAFVRFENKQKLPMFFQLTEAGYDREMPKSQLTSGLELIREFRAIGGDSKAISETGLGDEIEVRLRVRSLGGAQSHVAIVDLLPGGFEPSLDSLGRGRPAPEAEAEAEPDPEMNGDSESEGGDAEGQDPTEHEEGEGEPEPDPEPYVAPPKAPPSPAYGASTFIPDYVDIREDRVVIYGSVPADSLEFIYRIKATNRGKYRVPPLYGEGMYDRAVKARSLPSEMTVK